jgi:hypothetical protein
MAEQPDPAGRAVRSWCFMPARGLVLGDMLLAQKLRCAHSIFARSPIPDRNHGALGLLSKPADPTPPPRAPGSTAKAPAD